MPELFDLPQLATKLDVPEIDGGLATLARATAAALIVAELGAPLPDPVPEALVMVGLQVAARIYVNPQGATPSTPEQAGRPSAYLGRDERAVVASFSPRRSRGGPLWSFPPPAPWVLDHYR